jgi:hypothetical protein
MQPDFVPGNIAPVRRGKIRANGSNFVRMSGTGFSMSGTAGKCVSECGCIGSQIGSCGRASGTRKWRSRTWLQNTCAALLWIASDLFRMIRQEQLHFHSRRPVCFRFRFRLRSNRRLWHFRGASLWIRIRFRLGSNARIRHFWIRFRDTFHFRGTSVALKQCLTSLSVSVCLFLLLSYSYCFLLVKSVLHVLYSARYVRHEAPFIYKGET